ncbi:MAG: hypothetical protein QM756_15230 [Polyangiaceae bacterium]
MQALREDAIEILTELRQQTARHQARADGAFLARWHAQHVVRSRLGTLLVRVRGGALAVHHVAVEGVFGVRRGSGDAEQALTVGLVLGEQELPSVSTRVEGEHHIAERSVRHRYASFGAREQLRPLTVAFAAAPPRPRIAKPQRRQHVQACLVAPRVLDRDADQNVFGPRLGVLRDHVEVLSVVERPAVGDLELRLLLAARAIFFHQARVGKLSARILVQRLQVRRRRRSVQVVVELLDVLTVIAFRPGQAEQALLQDGVAFVPQREREAQARLAVTNAEQAIFAPAVGAAARLIVGEVVPALAVRGVVFTHRAPLALGKVRAPALPILDAPGVLTQALALGGLHMGARRRRGIVAI